MNNTYIICFSLRVWQKYAFLFSFFQIFVFTFRLRRTNIHVDSMIIFSKWISKKLWASSIWTTETFWFHCGSVNYTNVYNDWISKRVSERERERESEREREREAGNSKFHLLDLLLVIVVYLGDATLRHFDGRREWHSFRF